MIKKILSIFLVSSVLFVFATTGSMADRPTFAVGVSQAYGGYEASGTENEGTGTQETHDANETGVFAYTSVFLEASFADRITVGASWMSESIDTAVSERTDNVATGNERAGSNVTTGRDTGTSSVKAEFSNFVTGYIELNIWNGLYAKYGVMEMDLETKESLHTDSTYPNATMDGNTYGLGWKGSFDNGLFIKTETMMQDWSRLKLTASGCTNTCNGNTVDVDLTGAVATISIGKAF